MHSDPSLQHPLETLYRKRGMSNIPYISSDPKLEWEEWALCPLLCPQITIFFFRLFSISISLVSLRIWAHSLKLIHNPPPQTECHVQSYMMCTYNFDQVRKWYKRTIIFRVAYTVKDQLRPGPGSLGANTPGLAFKAPSDGHDHLGQTLPQSLGAYHCCQIGGKPTPVPEADHQWAPPSTRFCRVIIHIVLNTGTFALSKPSPIPQRNLRAWHCRQLMKS